MNNDFCDVTLSVYPQRASLKNSLATVGIEPSYDLWNTSPMLCQLKKSSINKSINVCTRLAPDYLRPVFMNGSSSITNYSLRDTEGKLCIRSLAPYQLLKNRCGALE